MYIFWFFTFCYDRICNQDFVDGAAELLDAANIKEILVTDSVVTESKKPKNVQYITASELIGDAMVRIHERKPVSPLFKFK